MSEYRKAIENLIRDILGDFPQGFNAGVVAGVPGWAGDMAYMAQEYPRALLTDTPLRPPVEYAGTTDSIAKAAGYEIPGTFSGQLGAAVGGLLSPGPGDLAKFAPLGAMFLGTKAATASQDALSLAKAMDAAGATRDEIWKATGELGQPWMKGPDGEWRFEIPDDAAGYAPGREFARAQEFANSHANTLEHAAILRSYMEKNGVSVGAAKEWFESEFGRAPLEWSGQLAKDTPAPELQKLLGDAETRIPQRSQWSSRLGNVLDHPELYAAYPDLVNVPFHIKPPIEMAGADGMFHGKGEISILDDAAYGLSKGKSITAHEAQHAVQDMEGFARGGTPKTMGDEMGNLYEFNQKFNRAFEQFLTSPDDVAKSNAQQEMDYYLERIRKLQDLRGVASPEEAYARLAGEAEARNVQSRMNMTMPERLATPPWKTLDVPEEQLIVRKGLLDGPALSIPFWHGSPHKFDAFDLSKMGTGEGAQAYGWGAYGADARDVADQYRINLAYNPDEMRIGGKQINDYYSQIESRAAQMPTQKAQGEYDKLSVIERLMGHATLGDAEKYADEVGVGDWFRKEVAPSYSTFGNLYRGEYAWPDPAKEAATPLTGEDLLQWDKPLSEQSDTVKAALERAGLVNFSENVGLSPTGEIRDLGWTRNVGSLTGEQLYRRLIERQFTPDKGVTTAGRKLSERDAALALSESGIPGIRYLDGMSRDGGSGTYNYVMFDDKGIKLLERNGKPIGGLLDKKR